MNKYSNLNIINNNVLIESNLSDIELFIENYFYNSIKIFVPDYFNQLILLDNNNSINIYKNIINKYLIEKKNFIRLCIKKNNYKLIDFNNFLEIFIDKLIYINNFIKSNIFVNEISIELYENIISDNIIFIILENNLIKLDYSIKKNINKLFDLVKKINNFNQTILNNFTKYLGNIYLKNMLTDKYCPLPDNLKKIQSFYNDIKYFYKIDKYYEFLENNYKLNIKSPVIIKIIIDFCEILNSSNNIYDIDEILNNTFNIIETILDYVNIKKLSDSIFENFLKVLQLINFNNNDDIFIKFNILKYIIIFTKKCCTIKLNVLKKNINNIEINNSIFDFLVNHINILINNSNINEIFNIINIISYIKNYDIFINKYYLECTKRLLYLYNNNNFLAKINIEENIYKYLYNVFTEKYVYKIYKIINDANNSYKINKNFINNYENNKLSIFITSYDCWQINQSDGFIKSSDETCSLFLLKLNDYNNYYNNMFKHKHIKWLLHYGEITIKYMNNIFIMLPIQYIILEMFDIYSMILYDTIINNIIFKNYSTIFKINIISSLIKSNLLIQNKEYLILNNNFISNNELDNINLIDIYINNFVINNSFEENIKYELCHTRENIISTNINSLLKKFIELKYSELFNKVKNCITVFDVTSDIFDKTVKYMVDMDYIKISDELNLYVKIYY